MKEEISRDESKMAQHMLQWALTDKLETPTEHGDLDLPGYKVTNLLGRGGMGAVYRAEEEAHGRTVAVKVFTPSGIDADLFVERLRREGQMLAQMKHKNVVGIHSADVLEDGTPYLVLEYVHGHDLSKRLELDKKIAPTEALRIAVEVCKGLSAAHSLGIIHRDVKPANVLLGKRGEVKVSDFGISKGADEDGVQNTQLTLTGTMLGTVDYMSPEQADGQALDTRADVYSVGVLIYEMLTGVTPRGAFEPLDKLGFPKELSRLVMRCLQRDPDKRPASATNLSQSLRKIREDMIRRKRAKKPLVIAGVAALLAICLVFYAAIRKNPAPRVLGVELTSSSSISSDDELVGGENLEGNSLESKTELASSSNAVDQVGEWVDLIAMIDIAEHRRQGSWYKSARRVWCADEEGARLALPFQPGSDYKVEFDFIREEGLNAVAVFLPTSIGMVNLEIDAYGEGLTGIHELNGVDLAQEENPKLFEIENGRLYHLSVSVSKRRVIVFINSQEVGIWRLKGRAASLPPRWNAPSSLQLAIGAWDSRCIFTNLQIQLNKG